jgi:glycosyltransferase involved in cell wall biosynthesis
VRVQIHPADDGGCGTYRLIWPAQVLHDAGYDIDLRDWTSTLDTLRQKGPLGDRLLEVDCQADVIVFQRPLRQDLVELIPTLQAQGTAVVVEVDDDFHGLPPGHPARTEVSPARNPRRNKLWLRRACELADLVTVSTPALAEVYGSHGRAVVLENCVPAAYLDIDVERTGFGWTGSTHTHIDDLRVVGDAAAAMIDRGHHLRIVGTGVGVAEQLVLGARPFTTTGWVPIERYPWEYAGLGVAMCPLQDNRFNRAKSWLKMAEAAALGVPVIGSPTDEYRRLAEMGVGVLAESWDDWCVQLLRLLGPSPACRVEMAAAGRAWAAEWTYERRAWRWIEAWAQALANRRGRAAA